MLHDFNPTFDYIRVPRKTQIVELHFGAMAYRYKYAWYEFNGLDAKNTAIW